MGNHTPVINMLGLKKISPGVVLCGGGLSFIYPLPLGFKLLQLSVARLRSLKNITGDLVSAEGVISCVGVRVCHLSVS